MEPISVLIADDHLIYRDGLRGLLSATDDTRIVGEATNGEEAVELAALLQPDVILMDIRMPGLNGIEASRRILQAQPQTGILILTMFEDDNSVFTAMRAGARGYLLKGADHAEVLRAIQAVHKGEAIFSPAIAQRMMHFFSHPPASPSNLKGITELTEREREVLQLIAEGYYNQQIADKLSLSSKTVRNHISNIFNKLQVADRQQAILRAREAGFGSGNL